MLILVFITLITEWSGIFFKTLIGYLSFLAFELFTHIFLACFFLWLILPFHIHL